jgi:N-acetyl-anhydromuramyl-L-alanine amidase AmpD
MLFRGDSQRHFSSLTLARELPEMRPGHQLDGDTMQAKVRAVGSAVLMAVAVGCAPADGTDVLEGSQQVGVDDVEGEGESQPEGTSLDALFADAGNRFDVPAALLKSIAWVETRWHMVEGEVEFEGLDARVGMMALEAGQIDEAAALAGEDVELVRSDAGANIRAAAALLSSYADEAGIDRSDLASWAKPAALYSGIDAEEGRAAYVHEEVFRVLRYGIANESAAIEPTEVFPDYPYTAAAATPGPDYANSVWRASPNHSARPSGTNGKPQMVIIHTCEGAYSGCWSWLANSSSGVSAHYVVNSTGSEISQLVRENRKAWHIAATYQCSRNDSVACNLNNVSSNNFTIGIEHAGFASQASWDAGLLQASADLTCNITADQGIPRDEWHIVGHGQLQPYNRVDPGPNWPWANYLQSVDTACGDGGGPPPPPPPPPPGSDPSEIIVDSNQAANGDNAAIELSGSWTASTSVAGYYNSGYYWRSTGSTSDLARFKAYLSAPKQMIIEAWWPAAADRSQTAPFIIYDGNGQQLDTVYKNQRQNGGQWVTLGTYALTAGWNVVALSRWTNPGDVVVADAVRFREAP